MHQVDEDFALAPTLTTETSHDFLQTVMELSGLRTQGRGGFGIRLADSFNEMKAFFVPCKGLWHRSHAENLAPMGRGQRANGPD
jgi:hypothetical protein